MGRLRGRGVNGASCGRATCATMGDEVHQLTGWQALQKKKKKKGQPPRGSLARASGVQQGLPGAGSPRSAALGDRRRAAGPDEDGLGGLECCSGLFLFHGCSCTERSRSGTLPPSPGPPGNLRHSHLFPHVTWGRLRRPASPLPPCLPSWPPSPGSGAWESRSRGGGSKEERVGRLGSWGCLRKRGPPWGVKGGGGPGLQRPRGQASSAARRSGGCRRVPPITHPPTFPLGGEAGQQEAEGRSFSFMAKPVRDLLLRQGALSTTGEGPGRRGRDAVRPASVLPRTSPPLAPGGLAPGSGRPRLPWNVLPPAHRLSQSHPPPRFRPNRAS